MAEIKTFRYRATAYKQGSDPKSAWIISFVAKDHELREWVGIPRRGEKGLVGFQRMEDPERVDRAKEFFSQPLNQSPTALIVGIHQSSNSEGSPVRLEFDGEDGNIRSCTLVIDFDSSVMTDDQIRRIIKDQIDHRLAREIGVTEQEDDVEEVDSNDEQLDDAGDGEEDETRSIELGRSLLNSLSQKLDDESWFACNREALMDYAKPATLIDGQHRLLGAEATERGIPFSVCALYDCSWSEQVFQFTIVNYTQKGIPDQFITANAALSLTKEELGGLEGRLRQARVKVVEYELMRVVNFDVRSPFFQLVDLSDKSSSDKIGYKTMVKVAKQWWTGKNYALKPIIDNLYPEVTGKKTAVQKQRLDRWQTEDWGDFFIAFWQVVKEVYTTEVSHVKGHSLWDVGHSNLMLAVTLLQFQTVFLEDIGDRDKEFFQNKSKAELILKIQNRARQEFLTWYPAEYFATEWKIKSLNTGVGRETLNQSLDSMKKKRGQFQYKNSALFTGRTQ